MLRFRIARVFATLTFSVLAFESDGQPGRTVKLNPEAFEFARDLINHGRFVADMKGDWNSDLPTRSHANDFIRERGFAEYAKWFLALDDRHGTKSKGHHKFPFGDFQNVHRCGLLAIKARAHEYGYKDIEAAAAELIQMIESVDPRGKERVD